MLVRPADRADLVRVFELATHFEVPICVLGGGFNTLVRDEGIRGIVVHLGALRKVHLDGHGYVTAEAGATHSRVTRFCEEHGLSGLEFAVGIPGTVGGWVAMNAGLPDREMKDVIERVEILMPDPPERVELSRSELRFRYRALEAPRGVVLGATFRTETDEPSQIRSRMQRHLDHRRRTQPIDRRSCGSVFKNPPKNHAARLIDSAGLKGFREGDAEISTVHANFIVNRGRATASDVLRLIEQARSEVLLRSGVELETEVRIMGGESEATQPKGTKH